MTASRRTPADAVHALVVAKAPVAGLTKTRLAAVVGDDRAAELSAAAFLDTLRACRSAFGVERCHVALAGNLDQAVDAGRIRASLRGWTVRPQIEGGFAERLVHAHQQVPGPVVQVGTDTPQLTSANLHAVVDLLDTADAVLGPADDGGWWALALKDPRHARCLLDVPMSTETTGHLTQLALVNSGLTVALAPELRDVDVAEDAEAVAAAAPNTEFAQQWSLRSSVA